MKNYTTNGVKNESLLFQGNITEFCKMINSLKFNNARYIMHRSHLTYKIYDIGWITWTFSDKKVRVGGKNPESNLVGQHLATLNFNDFISKDQQSL